MAKKTKSKLQTQLEELANLKGIPLEGEPRAKVEAALGSSSNHLVASAVNLISEQRDDQWRWEVEEVFSRFMEDPVKTDPGCSAKLAAVQALNKMECEAAGVFTRAVAHIQVEPTFGGSQDTAAALRGHALAGLVAMGHRDCLLGVPLLADAQAETRYMAADALGYAGTESAQLLLRLKAHSGDEDNRVTAACFSSLLRLDKDRSLDFVAGYLDHNDAGIKEAAALALGESHHPDAFLLLENSWHQTLHNGFREFLILPIALLRNEASTEFLLNLIGHGNTRYARAALEGLAILKHDQSLVTRVEKAAKASRNSDLGTVFNLLFS